MAKLLLLVLLSCVFVMSYGRHIHPKTVMHTDEDLLEETAIPTDIDGIPIEVISQIKPTRFVPVNNVLFFSRYLPCEEGFERDVLGVCREVWD